MRSMFFARQSHELMVGVRQIVTSSATFRLEAAVKPKPCKYRPRYSLASGQRSSYQQRALCRHSRKPLCDSRTVWPAVGGLCKWIHRVHFEDIWTTGLTPYSLRFWWQAGHGKGSRAASIPSMCAVGKVERKTRRIELCSTGWQIHASRLRSKSYAFQFRHQVLV